MVKKAVASIKFIAPHKFTNLHSHNMIRLPTRTDNLPISEVCYLMRLENTETESEHVRLDDC